MIPKALSEWSLDVISQLLDSRIHESEEFDFKQALPDKSDESGKSRLHRSCCAFANSGGGFLVFGIADDRNLPSQDRLIGIDPNLDFPLYFGVYPSRCEPSVHWTFRNPPIGLSSGSVIHLVHIPRSWKAPHGVRDKHEAWRFSKRTNKGTEDMTIEEIRSGFLNFYEKRLRLQLLNAELMALSDSVKRAFIPPYDEESSYSLITFEMQTIESVVADTYPITAEQPQLLATLHRLRHEVMVANNKARIFFATANLSFTNQNQATKAHNEFMARANARIADLAEQARSLLAPLLIR